MARKNSSKNYYEVAPIKVLVSVIILAILLTSALFVAAYNQPQNTQTSQTHAAAPTPTKCQYYLHGTCYNVYSHYCPKRYRQGYCPGTANVQCCPR